MKPATVNANEVIARYLGGERVVSIAESLHISRQRVYQLLGDNVKKDGRSHRKIKSLDTSPYVNLREWLKSKDSPNYVTFLRAVFGGANPQTVGRMRTLLDGGEQASLTVQSVRRMEQITGMTFDQIFFKEDYPHDQQRL